MFNIFRTKDKELGNTKEDKNRYVAQIAKKKNKNTSLVAGIYSLEDEKGNTKKNSVRKVNNGLLLPIDNKSAKLKRKSAVGNKLHEVENKKLNKTNKKISDKTDIRNINKHLFKNNQHKNTARINRNVKKKYYK